MNRPLSLALALLFACPGGTRLADDGGAPAAPDAGATDAGEPDAGDLDAGLTPAPRCLDEVALRFGELPLEVDPTRYLGARHEQVIAWPHYTSDASNGFGLGEHIEGVQRLGRFLLLTGAGSRFSPPAAHLIVIEMGSRSEVAAWAEPSYGYDWQNPPQEDRVVSLVELDSASFHAGGSQLFGDVLAVPLYGATNGQSEIRFYRVTDPRAPVELAAARVQRAASEAKAVALTDRPDGGYLLLAWDDVSLDFFVSKGARLEDGFSSAFTTVRPADVVGGFQSGGCGISGCGTYQNVNFVRQCDGTLFFVGTRNTQKGAPAVDGDDLAALYRVDGDGQGVTFVSRRAFGCHGQQCNFAAGAGVFVRDATHLLLYGASHWLHDGNRRYNFNEYAAP